MLLGNYNIFNNNPGRAIGGPTDPTLRFKAGTMYNFYLGDHVVSGQTDKSSFPDGYRPPYTWLLAPKSGALSSHNQAGINTSQSAVLAGGLPASGSTTITFSQSATGSLIKLASGTATITISGAGSIAALALLSGQATATITATATGVLLTIALISGQATITISPNALIGALAGLSSTATITLTPTATMKAIGYLAGLSTSETEFSANALAQAVWDALDSDFALEGTKGKVLRDILQKAKLIPALF